MFNSLDDRLKARYGQARFNPAGGQQQMTFQEWIDRHPALTASKNYDQQDARAKYEEAVSAEGGARYQAANPDWRTEQIKTPAAFDEGGTHVLHSDGTTTPNERRVNPTATPDSAPADQKRRFAMSYKDFVAKHGGKSTAALGGAYKQRAGRELSIKEEKALAEQKRMREAALRRGKGGGGTPQGTTTSRFESDAERKRRRPRGGGSGNNNRLGNQTVTPI